ncbi:MAG TPA: hypothetical protein VIK18_05445 [Pirellulales bacterium]
MDFVRPSAAASLSLGRARAARVLIVGPLGQGVGLATDALALAAAQSGSPAATVACMRPALGQRACATLVRLGDVSDARPDSADLLLAFGVAAAIEARSLLSPTGTGLVLTQPRPAGWRSRLGAACDASLLDGRIRCWPGPIAAEAQLARVWTLLGWLSARIGLSQKVWRPVLHASVPRRLSVAAQLAFAAGRAIDSGPQRF